MFLLGLLIVQIGHIHLLHRVQARREVIHLHHHLRPEVLVLLQDHHLLEVAVVLGEDNYISQSQNNNLYIMKKIMLAVILCYGSILSAQTLSYNDIGVLFSKENFLLIKVL